MVEKMKVYRNGLCVRNEVKAKGQANQKRIALPKWGAAVWRVK